ncbi:E3 ubiquitin-protein ligase BRE1-like 1 [Silene latifolia]|uniref:E3 ubiquitin-protein ligase BRE1-like 1 n=1 Tax=Silene latifolia TaxID=37657 RepID=UPI003D77401B
MGSKVSGDEGSTDKHKDLKEMESRLKELSALSSLRLQELKRVHEERVEILKKLSVLQGTLKDVKSISSGEALKMVKEELEKSKTDAIHYQSLYEKLQVEKDKVLWKERDTILRNDVGESYCRILTAAGSSIDELEGNLERQKDQLKKIEVMREKTSAEPGRKEIISNFRLLATSFPEDMSSMQRKLQKYKDTASDVHSLSAERQIISNVLVRKAKELVTLSSTSTHQDSEIQRLQAVVEYLKKCDMDLKQSVEMYRRESILPSNCLEARDKELKAWAHVHSLESSLDEHNMESRVRTAVEAEAVSQQRLAATEVQILDLIEKCESFKRNKSKLSNDLKSKHDENEAYLSEIEAVGEAYKDLQNQNKQLMKQITESDDYDNKLVLECLGDKQTHDSLMMEKQVLQKKIQQANVCKDALEVKAMQIDDQVKKCAGQIHRLSEDRCKNTIALENIQGRMFEARKSSQKGRETLDELQLKVNNSRLDLSRRRIELERERFEKRRLEEELEAVKRKDHRLRAQKQCSVVGKPHLELQEYKDKLKCGVCLDRPKEVAITKCCHLVCNPCVQKVLRTGHPKCPSCAASFGPNDVKPVNIC